MYLLCINLMKIKTNENINDLHGFKPLRIWQILAYAYHIIKTNMIFQKTKNIINKYSYNGIAFKPFIHLSTVMEYKRAIKRDYTLYYDMRIKNSL